MLEQESASREVAWKPGAGGLLRLGGNLEMCAWHRDLGSIWKGELDSALWHSGMLGTGGKVSQELAMCVLPACPLPGRVVREAGILHI